MGSQFDRDFSEERKEWTARKHRIIRQYFKVAIAKLAKYRQPIWLVDGYAGANEYGGEAIGSTHIMADLAHGYSGSVPVRVLACEQDEGNFKKLCRNLQAYVDSGILTCRCGPHSENVGELITIAQGGVAVVFLDPERPSSFAVEADLMPWCHRHGITDVLGLFFPQAVARISSAGQAPELVESQVGLPSLEQHTVTEALARFEEKVGALKKFYGMYLMRKEGRKGLAYGIYGLSDSVHGFALLSDTVARDYSSWQESTPEAAQGTLFAGDPDQDPKAALFEELLMLALPYLRANQDLKPQELARKCLETQDGRKFFGQFKESDYVVVKKRVLERLKG